jgi:sirohydrochlorin cobaltochelatase
LLKNFGKLSSAYLLVSHGSRDPRSQIALEQLAKLLNRKLQTKYAIAQSKTYRDTTVFNGEDNSMVGTACLELATLPLHKSIQQFATKAKESGVKQIEILPLFLLGGTHVKEDIPREIAIAQQDLENSISLQLNPYLGSNPRLIELLARQFKHLAAETKILMSHGSRYPNGNHSCEAIAAKLNAIPAYWSVSPTLAEIIAKLAQGEIKKVAILPYFLFVGGITDAIATQVQQLQQDYPKLELLLGNPLGATAELADLIVEELN